MTKCHETILLALFFFFFQMRFETQLQELVGKGRPAGRLSREEDGRWNAEGIDQVKCLP